MQALSNMTWACARMGHYDEKLFDAVAARVAVSWEHIFSWDLGNYAWGLGKAYGELGIQGSALANEDREMAIHRYLSDNPSRYRVSLAGAIKPSDSRCMPASMPRHVKSNVPCSPPCMQAKRTCTHARACMASPLQSLVISKRRPKRCRDLHKKIHSRLC